MQAHVLELQFQSTVSYTVIKKQIFYWLYFKRVTLDSKITPWTGVFES